MMSSLVDNFDTKRTMVLDSPGFDSYVGKLMREWQVPGLAIAVVDGGKTTVKNYGVANLEERNPITDETIFDCASTSKSFTAATVALILEDAAQSQVGDENCCDFDTPVKHFLPDDFVLEDQYYTDNVTIEDILSHRSGMPRHDDSYFGALAREQDNPCSITRNLRNLSLARQLRTTYQYCNMMYTVATHLVSQVSGTPFATFLQKRILNVLGMNNTYLNVPGIEQYDSLKSRMATGYYYSEETQEFKAVPFVDQCEAIGAGSIFSSVSDYAKWLRCMMNKTLPLSDKSHQELVKPRIIVEPEKIPEHGFSHTLYALGWEVKSYRGHRIVGHDGCVWGFNSSMMYLPELNWGMVVFCNGNDGAGCNDAIAMKLLDDLLEIPAGKRMDWNDIKKNQFEKCKEESAAEETKEDERDDEETSHTTEPLEELPLATYTGVYHNKGYHDIVLRLENDMLVADCTDRTFQFYLHVQRKEGNHFICRLRDNFDCTQTKIKVRFRRRESDGLVLQFGVNLEAGLNDLIWFDRVAEM